MTYCDDLKTKLTGFYQSSQNRYDRESAQSLLLALDEKTTGAAMMSGELTRIDEGRSRFSPEYENLLQNYDVERLISENLSFGTKLTIVAHIDDLHLHQVQLCQNTEADFGGVNASLNPQNIELLLHYPDASQLKDYVVARFVQRFPNANVKCLKS